MWSSIIIVIVSVAAADCALWVVVRFYASKRRKAANDLTGPIVGLIGTTYAVLLAFLLASLWNYYQQAKINAQLEAADLVNIFRVAKQFPDPERKRIEDLAHRYANVVLNIEWPEMMNGKAPHGGGPIINDLWTISEHATTAGGQSLAMAELMSSLSSLTQHRGVRVMQSDEGLPAIMWAVLVGGAVVTILASCLFEVENFGFHLLQITLLSFLLSLVLVTIASVDRPYQGGVRVSSDGFAYVLRTINAEGVE